ncbi:hypothetical protein A3K87_05060 [Variovorax paradoxus]|uniref:Uncharacterized protein n=1 Tax=Variovorax paradoxus TaxID=34073 RepID=A0AA91DUJ8_VARPD|nr:hypothetical protein [Variovorax paradoxus]OAK66916.1 hypothetical protein A3K87_05060 [Variovorax paradoxus]
MQHLINILAGVGDVLAAFGTAPSYQYPKVGDRSRDVKKIGGDWQTVGRDMKKALDKEQRDKDGKVYHGAT